LIIMAIVDITETVQIPAAKARVFAYLADARNDVHWKGGFIAAELVEASAVAQGALFKLSSKMMGMTNTVQVRLSLMDEAAGRLEFDTVDGMVKNKLTYKVEANGDHSLVTLHNVLEAAAPIANMAGRMLKAQVPKDLARLPLQFSGAGHG
jgi:carbon monoxide dehydrogenase subunit G